MKSKLLLFFILFCTCDILEAQRGTSAISAKKKTNTSYDRDYKSFPIHFNWRSINIGFAGGASTYWGDLQSEKITWSQSQAAGGLFLSSHLNKNLAVRFFMNYGKLIADDARSTDIDRVKRNLSFRSNLFEFGFLGEYHLKFIGSAFEDQDGFKLSPYAVLGINVFYFNPQAQYQGQWFDLKPLQTEGQGINHESGTDYSLVQIGVPIGIGLRYKLSPRTSIAFELCGRKTLTDYLDDVSTSYPDLDELKDNNGDIASKLSWRGNEIKGREHLLPDIGKRRGNSDNNDWYFMSMVNLSFKLGRSNKDAFVN